MFGPAWTSPVPFPYHLDTPSQAPSAPSQPHPQPQHNRTKRNRPPHDPSPSSTQSHPSSLLFTPPPSTPPVPLTPMSDIQLPSSSKSRLLAAGFAPTPSSHLPHSSSPFLPHPPRTPLSPHLLRQLSLLYLSQHQYVSAIFYADKLCSLASPAPSSPTPSSFPPLSRVLLLATALHRHGQHRRAIHLLRNRTAICQPHTLANAAGEMDDVQRWVEDGGDGDEDEGHGDRVDADENDVGRANDAQRASAGMKTVSAAVASSTPASRARLVLEAWHLLSLCLFHCRDYDEALLAMAPDDAALVAALSRMQLTAPQPSLLSSLCFLRAEVYSQQQHRSRALTWYLRALHYDSACIDAFDRLIEGRLLSWAEERDIMAALTFDTGMEWLELVYWNKIDQFNAREDDAHAHAAAATAEAVDVPMTPVGRKEGERGEGLVGRLSVLSVECGLVDNVELYTALVNRLYHRYDLTSALTLSSRLLTSDPYEPHLLPLHLLLLASTSSTSHLFYISHQLSTSLPSSPLSSYAIGLYYFAIRKFDLARRFFSRASTLDPLFLPAYLGFAHAFAAQEEGDQAMIAYRTAARLFEGSHLPLLCLGIEYAKAGNTAVAEELLKEGLRVYPTDPLTLNELGVLAYRKGGWVEAVGFFRRALALVAAVSSSSSASSLVSAWEVCCINMGHALRKQRRYAQALVAYQQALAPPAVANLQVMGEDAEGAEVESGEALGVVGMGAGGAADGVHRAVLTSMGFTCHLMGELDQAIQLYHQVRITHATQPPSPAAGASARVVYC